MNPRRADDPSDDRHDRALSQRDPGTAGIALVELVQASTEHWFDVRGHRVPSSKAFLDLFANAEPELGDLLRDFYVQPAELEPKFDLAERMVEFV